MEILILIFSIAMFLAVITTSINVSKIADNTKLTYRRIEDSQKLLEAMHTTLQFELQQLNKRQ